MIGSTFAACLSALATLRSTATCELHEASGLQGSRACFRGRQGRFGSRSDHCAFFLRQRGKQVQDERINIRAKLNDKERDAMRH
jgi:hypothetical protein